MEYTVVYITIVVYFSSVAYTAYYKVYDAYCSVHYYSNLLK